MRKVYLFVLMAAITLSFHLCTTEDDMDSENWQLKPFHKVDSLNPILEPLPSSTFYCPVRQDTVYWESKDVFNPAAVVKDDTVFMIYRAEDKVGKYKGTSRIGLGYSPDGLSFTRYGQPVFYPANDSMKIYEWEGGVEDPRVVKTESGRYIMTYTAYDGETARLCVASSSNLRDWEKHGLAFKGDPDLWSKSGAIITREEQGGFIASKINGKYWMYWGDTDMYLAHSDDLIDWAPVRTEKGDLKVIFPPRKGMFDSRLVEPGPPAMITDDGILLLYNSMNLEQGGDPVLPAGNYAAGQALMDIGDPSKPVARSDTYFITPEEDYEITGQIGNVCFVEGLVKRGNRYLIYYGTADSRIAVAVH